jgi:catechol 2,3-dioxygenase-like lactoylglutathione lyase family enzyme
MCGLAGRLSEAAQYRVNKCTRQANMFDRIGFNVANLENSKHIYLAVLAPLGLGFPAEAEGWAMIGGKSVRLWIGTLGPAASPVHMAFDAESRAKVRAFREAALAEGGHDNGGPGIRANDSPTYYAAFVCDPDGHNVEAV